MRVYRTDSEKDRMVNAREKKLLYGRRLEEQRIEMLERKAAEKAEEKVILKINVCTYCTSTFGYLTLRHSAFPHILGGRTKLTETRVVK